MPGHNHQQVYKQVVEVDDVVDNMGEMLPSIYSSFSMLHNITIDRRKVDAGCFYQDYLAIVVLWAASIDLITNNT